MTEREFTAAMARLCPTDQALIILVIERLLVAQRRNRRNRHES